jgi:hypothetical protein
MAILYEKHSGRPVRRAGELPDLGHARTALSSNLLGRHGQEHDVNETGNPLAEEESSPPESRGATKPGLGRCGTCWPIFCPTRPPETSSLKPVINCRKHPVASRLPHQGPISRCLSLGLSVPSWVPSGFAPALGTLLPARAPARRRTSRHLPFAGLSGRSTAFSRGALLSTPDRRPMTSRRADTLGAPRPSVPPYSSGPLIFEGPHPSELVVGGLRRRAPETTVNLSPPYNPPI